MLEETMNQIKSIEKSAVHNENFTSNLKKSIKGK
jgi:hypothetical protein